MDWIDFTVIDIIRVQEVLNPLHDFRCYIYMFLVHV